MNEQDNTLNRKLGLVDATMLAAGSMIGSGIFIVSADIARTVGGSGWLLFVWILTGFITVTAALSYGELAGMMPKAGGQYVYLQRAYNPLVSFLYGWTVFLVIQTGVIAAVAVAFAKFAGVLFPALDAAESFIVIGSFIITRGQAIAIALIALLSFTNSRGIENGRIIQLIFTSAKLLAMFALILCGLYFVFTADTFQLNMQNAFAIPKDINGAVLSSGAFTAILGVAMIGSLFSSDAWNNVTFVAGEIRQPQKNIPLSLLLGTLIVTVLYILTNVSYLALLPIQGSPDATDVVGRGIAHATLDRVGTAAASVILGNAAAVVMALLIMVSTFGCNNGLILSGSRVFYAMAKDGLFFKKAGTLNNKNVPAFAILMQGVWASVLCLSGTYGDLLDYATFASLLFYIITIAGIFILRKKEPDTPRPYKVWAYPVLPALYIILAAAICIDLLIFKTANTGRGLLIVLAGLPVFYLFFRNRSHIETNS